MKTHAIVWMSVVNVFVLSIPCRASGPAQDDPTAKGKPLSVWIKELKSPDYKIRTGAAEAIGSIGSRAKTAAPALREALMAEKRALPYEICIALWKVDRELFTAILKNTERTEEAGRARAFALGSLTEIGPAAKELAPAVLAIASNELDPNYGHALVALGSIGADPGDALPILTAALQGPSQAHRINAAMALGEMGEKAKAAIPVLQNALEDVDPQVRVDSANALWSIAKDHKMAVPVLTAAIREATTATARAARQRAIGGLGEIGPAAKDAFPALLALWKAEGKSYEKVLATKALKAIDAKAAKDAGVK